MKRSGAGGESKRAAGKPKKLERKYRTKTETKSTVGEQDGGGEQ